MQPRLRVLLMIGWQVFLMLLATKALIELLMFMQYITLTTQQSVETWIERVRLGVLLYIGTLTLLSLRQAPERSLEIDPRWSIILVVSFVTLCLVVTLFARSPLRLPVP